MSGPAFRRPAEGKLPSASEMRKIISAVERLNKATVAAPLEMSETGGIKMLRLNPKALNQSFWARITGAPTGFAYPWTEAIDDGDGTFSDGPRSGTTSDKPAYEVNEDALVPEDTIVRLWLAEDSASYLFDASVPNAAVCNVTSGTPDANGLYDAQIQRIDSSVLPSDPWYDVEAIKVIPMN